MINIFEIIEYLTIKVLSFLIKKLIIKLHVYECVLNIINKYARARRKFVKDDR